MKRSGLLAASLFLALCLSACSSSTNNNSKPETTADAAIEAEVTDVKKSGTETVEELVTESVAETEAAVMEEKTEEPVTEESKDAAEEQEKPQVETAPAAEYIFCKIAKQYIDIITPLNGDEYYFNLVYVKDTKYPQLAIGNLEDGMILREQEVQLYLADEEGNVQRTADFAEVMGSDGPAWYYERKDTVVLFVSFLGDEDFVFEWHVCRSDGSEIAVTQSEDEFKQYDQGAQKRFSEDIYTKEEILAYLNNIVSLSENNTNVNEELWKTAYKHYLYDVMADVEYVSDGLEAWTYSSANGNVEFALQDITEDGIPELWIGGRILSYNNGELLDLGGDENDYYDTQQKLLYANNGGYAESFTVYRFENGKFVEDHYVWNDEYPAVFRLIDGNEEEMKISEDEWKAMVDEFEKNGEKYRNARVKLTSENIITEFSKY